VYYTAHPSDGPDEVKRSFGKLSGYPGVGALSRPLASRLSMGDFSSDALDEIADTSVAVFVRAWDDEGFLVVPVAGQLTPMAFAP
jgi:hypothetical protein